MKWHRHCKLGLTAAAAAFLIPAFAAPAAAETRGRICNVDHVAVIDNRIHIKCAPNQGQAYTSDIRYYAMRLNESRVKIDNILKIAIESKRLKRATRLWYDTSDYQSVPGCRGSNCRVMKGLALE